MRITGTFIDEISHDIPHQNWGAKEWEMDFQYMKSIGIDTVILIRCGYQKMLTYPSDYLLNKGCYQPTTDLVELFLKLSEQYGIDFYFGLYDSGRYWETGDMSYEIDHNHHIIDEVWKKYGRSTAFKGWYLSMEISRKTKGAIKAFDELGRHCKRVSNGLPTMISPWIDGSKAVLAHSSELTKSQSIALEEHEKEWDEILDGIKEGVDIIAFQDGHLEYSKLSAFLQVNKKLADKYGLRSWTNAESFDRDMPIKFLPIKFDKLNLKLEAAEEAKVEKAITFEFSHFMSPQSMYPSAGHLYNRYVEHYLNH